MKIKMIIGEMKSRCENGDYKLCHVEMWCRDVQRWFDYTILIECDDSGKMYEYIWEEDPIDVFMKNNANGVWKSKAGQLIGERVGNRIVFPKKCNQLLNA